MKGKIPVIILGVAIVLALVSLFGEQGVGRLAELRRSVELQSERNIELEQEVSTIKREIIELKHDDRALEERARRELGMARPNERIYIFEDGEGSK